MKINVKHIPERGMVFNQTITAKELDLPSDVIVSAGPLMLHANFHHVDDAVIAKFEACGKYRFLCSRCLEDFEAEKTDRFEIIFEVDATTDFIDFSDDVRQELILAAEINPLCQKDCKGICVGCGENLNLNKCKCS